MPPLPSNAVDPRAELDAAIAELHAATSAFVQSQRSRTVDKRAKDARPGGLVGEIAGRDPVLRPTLPPVSQPVLTATDTSGSPRPEVATRDVNGKRATQAVGDVPDRLTWKQRIKTAVFSVWRRLWG